MKYKNNKRMYLSVIIFITIVLIAGCNHSKDDYDIISDIADSFPLKAEPVEKNYQTAESNGPYAVLHTTAGDITILLYQDQAPKAVENFIRLAESGYYNGTKFHYVKKGELAQTGKPVQMSSETATSSDGAASQYAVETSIWNHPFEDEFHDGLHNFTGAVGMAGDGTDNNLSQFYLLVSETKPEDERVVPAYMYMNELIYQGNKELNEKNQIQKMTEQEVEEFQEQLNNKIQAISTDGVPKEVMERYKDAIDTYKTAGGAWGLDYKYTVFGQIVEGLNIASAITGVKVEPSTRSPKKEIRIESIEIIP